MAWSWSLAPDTEEHAARIQLTDTERRLLALFQYMQETQGCPTIVEVCQVQGNRRVLDQGKHEAYLSLCRFGYIVQAEPRTVRHATVVDILSDSAWQRLAEVRARHFKCCAYAVRVPCVCLEYTYCPNPEHRTQSGHHGTHD